MADAMRVWLDAYIKFHRTSVLSMGTADQAAAAVIERAIAEAAEQERARIVEWLRGRFCQLRQHPEDQAFARMIAKAIERGGRKERADG